MKANRISFPTGSSFSGEFNKQTHSMEGFGNYKYPDGTEYRGFFARGRPHGFGKLILAHPYRLRLECHFENGEMKHVEPEMQFHDGLDFYGEVSEDFKKVDFSKWRYLHYVFKQTCRNILDRNLDEMIETEEARPLCLRSVTKRLHKLYYPGVCDPKSVFDPEKKEDKIEVCYSKGSTQSSSMELEFIPDAYFWEICKKPTDFSPTLPEILKKRSDMPSDEKTGVGFDDEPTEIK